MAKSTRGSDTFHIRIPDELRDEMLKACEADKTTPSHFIRTSIMLTLKIREKNLKDFEDLKQTEDYKKYERLRKERNEAKKRGEEKEN
jgi:hypothetical protein